MTARLLFKDTETNRTEWLEMRKTHIGSSDITTIAGMNRWSSPLELWAKMTGKVETPESVGMAAEYGKAVEPALRKMFALKEKIFDVSANVDTFQHATENWATATPDTFVSLKPGLDCIPEEETDYSPMDDCPYDLSGSEEGINELKHTSIFEGWDDGGAPNYAHTQLMWQLGILEKSWGFVTGVVGGRAADLKTPFFRFDQNVFDQLLILGGAFMDCIQKDIPPNAGAGDKALIEKIIARHERTVDLDEDSIKWIVQYDQATADLKVANKVVKNFKAEQEEAKNNLILAMEDATLATLPDGRHIEMKLTERKPYSVQGSSSWKFKLKKG